MGSIGIQINQSKLEASSPDSDSSVSILKKHVNGYWCCNCYHFVESDDIFVSKKHRAYLYKKLEKIDPPKKDYLACICKDCVYYRLQKCVQCGCGSPLCMFPISHWFESSGRYRKCIDCTAITDTKKILESLSNLCPSQCILQCNLCCRYKYVCSFSVFSQAYGDDATKLVRELDIKRDHKLYKRTVCFECRMNEDIALYRMILQQRYISKISDEPTLSNASTKISASKQKQEEFFSVLSYANAVVGKEENLTHHKVDVNDILAQLTQDDDGNENSGPGFFLSTMQDYISRLLVQVLQDEIISLRSKTEMELKLTGLPIHIWDEVLQRKMQFTTHMFSLQSSGLSNFIDPESRWAYTAVYTPVHASMVYDVILRGGFLSLLQLFANAKQQTKDGFEVSCFGAGPGSEVLGLHPFLPQSTKFHLFDNCTFWEHNAKYLLGKGLGAQFDFNYFDVQKKLKKDQFECIKKSKLLTFVKFVSAILNHGCAASCFQSIFEAAPSGSCFLIIDNSQPQLKNYVENLIFPCGDYKQNGIYKENDKYRMLTSYGEYRFDVADVMESHADIYRLLSLVMEWVERPPLVDIRVYIFLVEKK